MIKRNQLILGEKTYKTITEDIVSLLERFPPRRYFAALASAKVLFLVYIVSLIFALYFLSAPDFINSSITS